MSKIKIVQSPEKEKEVPTEVLASSIKAIAEGVSLYVSPADTFHIVGRLYALGVKGNHA